MAMLSNMTDDTERSTPEGYPKKDGVIRAMLLRSFAPPTDSHLDSVNEQYTSIVELAQEWQKTGARAIQGEAHAALLNLERNRVHELIGCIAAAGEQLGLAWTSQQDMQRWLASENDGQPMATRALAEACSYFALGSANAMANATLRTLLLNSEARSAIPNKTAYSPFSDKKWDWRSFDGNLVKDLKACARAIGNADADDLIFITEHLSQDEPWKLMVNRRGLDYHRWRPQSIEGGVPRIPFWEPIQGGGSCLSVRGSGVVQADPGADHLTVSEIATNGLLALADAMHRWLAQWPLAMAGVGAKIFKTS
jgi:hypothetical protein